jgi:hypothetical protein
LKINCRHAVLLKFSPSDREKKNFALRLSHRRAGIQSQNSRMQSSNANNITTMLNGAYCIPHCHMWKTYHVIQFSGPSKTKAHAEKFMKDCNRVKKGPYNAPSLKYINRLVLNFTAHTEKLDFTEFYGCLIAI